MKTIQQLDFKGIDTLKINEVNMPPLTPDGVMVQMNTWPVVPSDWKKESNPNATSEHFSKLPRTIGIGGVGVITQVGSERDQTLLNQRALILNPNGAYSEYIENTNHDWLFPLPENVSNGAAATLLAGAGTALMLQREVMKASVGQPIIITGANSVIGTYLLQLLSRMSDVIYPLVSDSSYQYLKDFLPSYQPITLHQLPLLDAALIIDIAGNENLLQQIVNQVSHQQTISVALIESSLPFKVDFVHESFNPQDYITLINKLNQQELKAPIGKTFEFQDIIEAQHYAKEQHSRGRVLIKLNQ